MADILFAGKKHEDLFFDLFKKMKTKDCYHGAAAYLLSLDTVIQDHINRVFDFKEDVIKPECLHEAWQTGTSKKTTRLLFNLWNGTFKDLKRPTDEDEEEDEEEAEQNEQERQCIMHRMKSFVAAMHRIIGRLYSYVIQSIAKP